MAQSETRKHMDDAPYWDGNITKPVSATQREEREASI
jgi:hypothetical protein